MRKINAAITIVLSVLAAINWMAVYYDAFTYVMSFDLTTHFYPALSAVVLSVGAITGWVLMNVGSAQFDGETRCRKCRHILRGISEPRCPECGTNI